MGVHKSVPMDDWGFEETTPSAPVQNGTSGAADWGWGESGNATKENKENNAWGTTDSDSKEHDNPYKGKSNGFTDHNRPPRENNDWGERRPPRDRRGNDERGSRPPRNDNWGGNNASESKGWGSNQDSGSNPWGDEKPKRDNSDWGERRAPRERRDNNEHGSRPPRSDNWGNNKTSESNEWGNNKDSESNAWGNDKPKRDNDNNWGGENNEGFGDGEERAPNTYAPEIGEDACVFVESGIAPGLNFKKFDSIQVNVTGKDVPPKADSFDAMNLNEKLLNNIKSQKYTEPTPCQKYSIPSLIKRRDIMCCAQTGSGKTAAFLLPILHNMVDDGTERAEFDKCQKPQAIILCPTRELVIQTYDNAIMLGKGCNLRYVMIYGGTSNRHQFSHLEAGANIVIATPGRLTDLIQKRKVDLTDTKYIVLDEADRMLDMGFSTEVKRFMALCIKSDRQVMMFSATFPKEIQKMAAEFLSQEYIFVAIGIVGSANPDIKQTVLEVAKSEKLDKLKEILQEREDKKVIIFVKMKKNADFLAAKLSVLKMKATSIHGDRYQEQREEALKDFMSGRHKVLVATSVASRGLDIPAVDAVINYDMPDEIQDYVHRIGRTARVGNVGEAIAFIDSEQDNALFLGLVRTLTDSQQEVPQWLSDAIGGGMGSAAPGFEAARDIREYSEAPQIDLNEAAKVVPSGSNGNMDWGEPAASTTPAVNTQGDGDDDWF